YRERLELFQYRKKVKFSLFYFPNIQSCFLSLHLPETLIVIASLTKVRRDDCYAVFCQARNDISVSNKLLTAICRLLKQGSASRKA
ncbi:MAG: hypothetical protein J6W29_09665, partial [Neisseriaceae bacterium]|nr:hypothetical protein [Neisseriaceae bacterium]